MHAAALLALAPRLSARSRLLAAAGLVMASGIALFAGDLAARELLARRLFPMAAPIGGGLLIAGWLMIALSGFLSRRPAA